MRVRSSRPGRDRVAVEHGAAGNISNQPWYVARRPAQSASVPVCFAVLVPSPSSPAQKLAKVSAAVQVTAASIQDADTLVNVPGRPADA